MAAQDLAALSGRTTAEGVNAPAASHGSTSYVAKLKTLNSNPAFFVFDSAKHFATAPGPRAAVADFSRGEALNSLRFSTLDGVRSDKFLAHLAAGGAAPGLALPAAPPPRPQTSSSSDGRMKGWVKALIVVGGALGGLAIWRAADGSDEDLAPFPN